MSEKEIVVSPRRKETAIEQERREHLKEIKRFLLRAEKKVKVADYNLEPSPTLSENEREEMIRRIIDHLRGNGIEVETEFLPRTTYGFASYTLTLRWK